MNFTPKKKWNIAPRRLWDLGSLTNVPNITGTQSFVLLRPKSKMYFNHGTKVWSKSAPDGAPRHQQSVHSQNRLNSTRWVPTEGVACSGDATCCVRTCTTNATAKQAFAAAKALNQNSGPSAKASVASASVASSTPKTTTTSMFNLGFGANHPKFEAAKGDDTAAARAIEATGGRKFAAKLIGGYATGGAAVTRIVNVQRRR